MVYIRDYVYSESWDSVYSWTPDSVLVYVWWWIRDAVHALSSDDGVYSVSYDSVCIRERLIVYSWTCDGDSW